MTSPRSTGAVIVLAAVTILSAERPARSVANPPDHTTAAIAQRAAQQDVWGQQPAVHRPAIHGPTPAFRASPFRSPPATQQAFPSPAQIQPPIPSAGQHNTAPRRQSLSNGTASLPQSRSNGVVTTNDQTNPSYAWNCSTLTLAVKAACTRAELAYYDNVWYTVKQTEKVYDEQYRETRIISWLLIVLFAASIGLAIAQFILALRAGNQNLKKSIETESTVKISKDGLEVSSSILGVILLAFSMVFFYLYLQTVYRIT
jgi:hypothetical protein